MDSFSYPQISVIGIGGIGIVFSIYSIIMFLFFKCTEMEERDRSFKLTEECEAKNNSYSLGVRFGLGGAVGCAILLLIFIYFGI